MQRRPPVKGWAVQEISAFSFYLRTGRRREDDRVERKYNHWHDPGDGRFTFSGQGRYFSGGAAARGQAQASSRRPVGGDVSNGQIGLRQRANLLAGPSQLNDSEPVKLALNGRNPRVRMRGNGGPPLHDPRTLEQVFPGLFNSPAGTIVAVADNLLGLTDPSRAQTTELSKAYANRLVREIQAIDPTFHRSLPTAGYPPTSEGQANHINDLRLARAKAYYQRRELRPLQVEIVRFLQRSADDAYSRGLEELKAGRLHVRLSPQEALGNYVDREVARELTRLFNRLSIASGRGELAQVNRRAYHRPENTYSRPDARVGNVSFDWSLTPKNLTTPQIRNFFRSDFQPEVVVIIRPSQLGRPTLYAIKKPSGR